MTGSYVLSHAGHRLVLTVGTAGPAGAVPDGGAREVALDVDGRPVGRARLRPGFTRVPADLPPTLAGCTVRVLGLPGRVLWCDLTPAPPDERTDDETSDDEGSERDLATPAGGAARTESRSSRPPGRARSASTASRSSTLGSTPRATSSSR